MDGTAGSLEKNMRNNLSRSKNGIVAGLDVGCSKICCFVARVDQGPLPRVIGIDYRSCPGPSLQSWRL